MKQNQTNRCVCGHLRVLCVTSKDPQIHEAKSVALLWLSFRKSCHSKPQKKNDDSEKINSFSTAKSPRKSALKQISESEGGVLGGNRPTNLHFWKFPSHNILKDVWTETQKSLNLWICGGDSPRILQPNVPRVSMGRECESPMCDVSYFHEE